MPTITSSTIARLQGAFYVLTGIWPLVTIRTFELVTGPKADRWLVKTVGVLVAVIGTTLLFGTRKERITPELRLLGIGSAAGLAGIDCIYVARQRIPPVYLFDACAEVLIVLAWCLVPPEEHS
jgi:hypothetical protein